MDSPKDSSVDVEDDDRMKIRKEISSMSFEDLQKLKERLGSKIYNEAMFGGDGKKMNKNKKISNKDCDSFKRANKNRPREMSSKMQVPRFREIVQVKKTVLRDPRFDSLCGTYNEKAFRNSYKFLNGIIENDIKSLKNELNDNQDPKSVKKIKYLIQRLENRQREEKLKEEKEQRNCVEKMEKIESLKQGEKPVFKKKSEKRVLDLVSQYEELKKTGKLKKHIERLRKKNASKDRKKFAAQQESPNE